MAVITLTVAGVVLGRRGTPPTLVSITELEVDPEGRSPDLPCPWCLGPTAEDDEACPTCGQVFGGPSGARASA